jgi:small-conductance mechanosensitive channel
MIWNKILIVLITILFYLLLTLFRSTVFLRLNIKWIKYSVVGIILGLIYPVFNTVIKFETLAYGSKSIVMVLFIVGFIYASILLTEINNPSLENDNRFRPPPNQYLNKNKRINNVMLIILTIIAIFAIMYYKYGYVNYIDIIISSLLLVTLLILNITYSSCKYNLPISWNI